jgi:hypothetical protein
MGPIVVSHDRCLVVGVRCAHNASKHTLKMQANRAKMTSLKRMAIRVCDPKRPLSEQYECQQIVESMRETAVEQSRLSMECLLESLMIVDEPQ